MGKINKSFWYGICFASLTWSISLYFYWQLDTFPIASISNNEPVFHKNKPNLIEEDGKNIKNYHFKDNVKPKKESYKNYIGNKLSYKNHINSDKLIKKLQPVIVNDGIDADDRTLSELGMVRSMQDQMIRDEGYKTHAFNVLVSNQLSYHRSIPDTRNKRCKSLIYPNDLPAASIIICFYNEHFDTLMRSLHSILDRTPDRLLEEIILIDDYSSLPDLHKTVSDYIKTKLNHKIKLFKLERREGLIRARIFGARKATGKVLIFLDSHIEVNNDWIQPLLARIKENRTNVVTPVIDIISAHTFEYSGSPLVRGGFNWGLHFKWENLPTGTLTKDEDFVKPIKSPTMAGGLFAIDRKYFIDLGEYDAGMDIWGGENLEISFRIWMCGGRLELIPCSRVGHVFRHRRPYSSPDGKDTMLPNSLRVAYVWMDDYKDYFLKQRPEVASIKYGDISSRIQLRKDLKCYDFDWYIKNVYPELTLPTDNEERLRNKWAALEQDKFQPWHSRKRNYVAQYQLRLSNTSLCVQSKKDVKTKGSLLVLKTCLRSKNQIWYETDKNEIVLAQLLCLQASKPNPMLYKCHEMGGDQEWKHKGESKTPIYNMAAGTCLGVQSKEIDSLINMRMCTDTELVTWDLVR